MISCRLAKSGRRSRNTFASGLLQRRRFIIPGWGRRGARATCKAVCGREPTECDRIICTSAFGMGLDVSNVRMVIHWQHTSSVEITRSSVERDETGGHPLPSFFIIPPRYWSDDIRLLRFMAKKTVESAPR